MAADVITHAALHPTRAHDFNRGILKEDTQYHRISPFAPLRSKLVSHAANSESLAVEITELGNTT
jgi:hypothetical protein